MHITQGTFSYLPALTDDEIRAQVQYCLGNGWSISVEFTDDPHPRNTYWDMWDLPMFDLVDAAGVLDEIAACRRTHSTSYVRVNAYDASLGRQTTAISFIVQRPPHEPGFRLDRQDTTDRRMRYSLHPYAADRPRGDRYVATGGPEASDGWRDQA